MADIQIPVVLEPDQQRVLSLQDRPLLRRQERQNIPLHLQLQRKKVRSQLIVCTPLRCQGMLEY